LADGEKAAVVLQPLDGFLNRREPAPCGGPEPTGNSFPVPMLAIRLSPWRSPPRSRRAPRLGFFQHRGFAREGLGIERGRDVGIVGESYIGVGGLGPEPG